MVRNPAWQAQVLAKPLAERRLLARSMRSESERQLAEPGGAWTDVDTATALDWLGATRSDTLVHGHTHHPVTELIAPGITRHVLTDWELDHATSPRAEVLRWQADGWSRLSPADAAR
jgi:UDP-2,3-diacylglucosamine hydrolase